jgi:LPXTG-motif cell wall-anchored protein
MRIEKNKPSLKTTILALSLVISFVGLFGTSVGAASITTSPVVINSTTDDPNVPSVGVTFSEVKADPGVSTRIIFDNKIQSTVYPEVYFMTGRISELCSNAIINKVKVTYDAKATPPNSSPVDFGSEFGFVSIYSANSIIGVSSVGQGGSAFGLSGVGGVFNMPLFNQLGVVAEWNDLDIPYSQNPGIAVSVSGYDGDRYVTLDNIRMEITYDDSACPKASIPSITTSNTIDTTTPTLPKTGDSQTQALGLAGVFCLMGIIGSIILKEKYIDSKNI